MKPIIFLALYSSLFATLREDLDEIVKQFDSKAHVGIEVVSVKTGQRLYQRNSDHLFVPANCSKLFTGAAALSILGVDYQFETKLFLDEEDNLYLKGSGDPTLSRYDIEKLVIQLSMRGVTEVGEIYVDNFDFDDFSQGPGWMWDEPIEYWNSPMDGLTVDHSSVHVWIIPGKQVAAPPLVCIDPALKNFIIQNKAVTGGEGSLKVDRRPIPNDWTIDVEGTISSKSRPLEFKIPVPYPSIYAGQILKNLLQARGIQVRGEIHREKTPAQVAVVAVHASIPLSQIVQYMMKHSDNLYADNLFKKMGQQAIGAPGTWQKGSLAIRQFLLRDAAIDPAEMVILDGSGLSRYNLLSPRYLIQLLTYLAKEFKCSAEFTASLPISGIDGSLKNRLVQARSRVRAETGSMTGIATMAGYVTTKDNDLLAFAVMINGLVRPTKEYKRDLEDAICLKLVNFQSSKK
jgi:D-alanyl-D-alanine carboxypeptidase/D-alanyl-D-alanine-endopeptidase (penicillin-binding protein 4)